MARVDSGEVDLVEGGVRRYHSSLLTFGLDMPAPVHVPHERTTTRRPHLGFLLLLGFGANGRNPMAVDWNLRLPRVELVQEDPAVLGLPRL